MPTKTAAPPEVKPIFQCPFCGEKGPRLTLLYAKVGKLSVKCAGSPDRPGCDYSKLYEDPRLRIRACQGLATRLGLGPETSLADLAAAVEAEVNALGGST